MAAICGKGDRIVPYEGSKFTAGRIQQWLVGFASGQECVRGLRIEKGGDLSHLRRGELEAVLTVLGKVTYDATGAGLRHCPASAAQRVARHLFSSTDVCCVLREGRLREADLRRAVGARCGPYRALG